MLLNAYRALAIVGCVVCFSACTASQQLATGPGDAAGAAGTAARDETQRQVPELNLNLPESSAAQQACACADLAAVNHTLLERGISALLNGDFADADSYFQRYQRLEKSQRASWETKVAAAYSRLMPNSPKYSSSAAKQAYQKVRKVPTDSGPPHEQVLIMHQALAMYFGLQTDLQNLEAKNAQLEQDLAKREAAIKRLRELTLGQKAGAR